MSQTRARGRREHAGGGATRRESDGRFSGRAYREHLERLLRKGLGAADASTGRGTRDGSNVAEMNEKRGSNNDRVSLSGRLPTGRAMPPELLLLLTAFVWGGYHPCMRMLLTDTTEHGSTPTPSEINLARFSLVAVLFVAQAACADAACFGRRGRRRGGGDGASLQGRGDAFGSTQSLVSAEEGEKGERKKLDRVLSLDAWMSAPPATAGVPVAAAVKNATLWGAAFELAFWHFVTIAFQSTGVAYTGATRAGFIAASTTMMVPFVSTLLGEAVRFKTWIAACVAMFGAALIVFDKAQAEDKEKTHHITREDSSSSDVCFGDALTLIGSVAWAVFLFRLSKLAPRLPPLKLAVARSTCMAFFVSCWFLVERLLRLSETNTHGHGHQSETQMWLFSKHALLLTAFMAIGPGWLCAWWQTVAQASVPAARAAVLTATTPLWGAAWAAATMGERMSMVGWLGGITIVGGTLLVALER